MKKLLVVGLILVIMGSLLLAACATPTQAPPTQPAPSSAAASASPVGTKASAPSITATTTAAPAAVIKLVDHNPGPNDGVNGAARTWLGAEIKKRTNGRVEVNVLFGAPLGKQEDQLKNLGAGVFDIGDCVPGYTPAELPLVGVIILPGLATNGMVRLYAEDKLYTEPDIVAELAKNNAVYLGPFSMPPYEIMSKKPIKTTADLKGMRIRGYSTMSQVLKNLGAVPLEMVFGEAYTAVERGTIDGVLGSYPDTFWRYKIYEVTNYLTRDMGFGTIGNQLLMNKKTWDKLPDDIKQIYKQLIADYIPYYYSLIQKTEQAAIPTVEKYKITVNQFSPEERAKVVAENDKVNKIWVDGLTAKGLPAQKILDAFKKYVKEAEQKLPTK